MNIRMALSRGIAVVAISALAGLGLAAVGSVTSHNAARSVAADVVANDLGPDNMQAKH